MYSTEIHKLFDFWPQKNNDQHNQLYWVFKCRDTISKDTTTSRITTRITGAKLRRILCFTANHLLTKDIKKHRLVYIFRGYMKILDNADLFENKQYSRAYASVQILNIITGLIDSINNKNIELSKVKEKGIRLNVQVRTFSGLFEGGCRQYINALQDCYVPTTQEDLKITNNGTFLCFPERAKTFCCKFLPEKIDENCIDLLTEYRIYETIDQTNEEVFVVTTTLMEIMYCWFEDLALYYETRVRFCEKNTRTRHKDNHWFSIMTFNVNEHKCKQPVSAMDYIENSACDVVCTQEDTKQVESKLYNCLKKCGIPGSNEPLSYEVEGIYYLKKNEGHIPNQVYCVEAVPTETMRKLKNYWAAKRTALIFNYAGLKIANVHLDGGLNVNTLLLTESEETIKALISFKLELVNRVLTNRPDIIMGDFNTVFITEQEAKRLFLQSEEAKVVLTRYNNSNIKKLDQNTIRNWNCALENLLLANGYVYAEPSNANEFQYIVDGIWYRREKIASVETFIDQIIWKSDRAIISTPCAFTDHNPVLARVYLK